MSVLWYFGVLSSYPLVDRPHQILEIGFKDVDNLSLWCLRTGLEIPHGVMQIRVTRFDGCKVLRLIGSKAWVMLRRSVADAFDPAPKFLDSVMECEMPTHLRPTAH